MKKIEYLIGVILITFLLTNCQKEKDTTFLITQESVGKINKTSLVSDLETIYALDSIIKDTTSISIGTLVDKIQVYEKGGKHLLTLTPNKDSVPTIENIRVYDPRFVTENGIGLNSTFKDIKDKYTIQKIIVSINNLVILIKDSPVYFTIDKQELPSSLRYGVSNIEAVQIPDEATIKYLMIGWE
ncbi:hypothetical protein GGR42_003178 [Saonia flava]|uniref:Uncharacterized protein n=1 Tax=Saonia flava TaxID=523696 RepID=A0A846QZR2_9FLAO|nr:hypothetical protein [Saonia flava]NJB72687.1 hypothetical protein [Saonia flava]